MKRRGESKLSVVELEVSNRKLKQRVSDMESQLDKMRDVNCNAEAARQRQSEKVVLEDFCRGVCAMRLPDNMCVTGTVESNGERHMLVFPVPQLKGIAAIIKKRLLDAP